MTAAAGTADLLLGCAGSAPLTLTGGLQGSRGCRTRMLGFGFGGGVPPDISAGMMGPMGLTCERHQVHSSSLSMGDGLQGGQVRSSPADGGLAHRSPALHSL